MATMIRNLKLILILYLYIYKIVLIIVILFIKFMKLYTLKNLIKNWLNI